MESIRQVSRSASKVFSGTALSRATGFLRDISMAAAFGGSPEVAAFFMAFRFANLPRRLFGEGAMHSAFVPYYEKSRAEGQEREFARGLMLLLALLLTGIVLIGEAGLLTYLWCFSSHQQVLQFTAIMLPSLVFLCLYGVNQSLLNCEKIYFLPSVAPAAFNCVWIVGAIWSQHLMILAVVVVIACCFQWLATLGPAMRILKGGGWRFNVRPFLKPLGLAMLGVGATQINSALDPIFARYADASGPAYLWYAIRLQQLPLALFGIGFASALLPTLSRAVKAGDHKQLLSFAYRRSTYVMVPATLALCFLPLVSIVYGRGAFGAAAIDQTTLCLRAYALGLLPQTLVLIQSAAYYAHGNYRTPAMVSAMAVAFNMSLNLFFVFGVGWGAESIALATTLSAGCQSIMLYGLGSRRSSLG